MTGKQFINAIANGKADIIGALLDLLTKTSTDYCIIGGLAVNAYVEPVVSLDLDIVIATDQIDDLCNAATKSGMKIKKYPRSVNLSARGSHVRVQIQMDGRYQDFIEKAHPKTVLGYKMKVARVEDVLAGKVWAYTDQGRRTSKRYKDMADIARLIERYPRLLSSLPGKIRKQID